MVAKAVIQSPGKQLPQGDFHIERDAVLMKKRWGAAKFNVDIITDTVTNVRINPDRGCLLTLLNAS